MTPAGPSPELDFLERLGAEDLPLHAAESATAYPFRDRDHAKQAIAHVLLDDIVALYDPRDEFARAIERTKARWMLENPAMWEATSEYRLRLTKHGAGYWRSGAGARWYEDIMAHAAATRTPPQHGR